MPLVDFCAHFLLQGWEAPRGLCPLEPPDRLFHPYQPLFRARELEWGREAV